MFFSLFWSRSSRLVAGVPLVLAYACASSVADVVFLAWRDGRQNTIDNMSHVLSGSDTTTIRRLARQSIRNYGKYLVDFIRAPLIPAMEFGDRFSVTDADWQILEQAKAGGKGVIIVPFHFGLWDRGGVLLSRRGHILHVLADHLRPKALDEAVIASRTGLGMRVIHLERSAVPIVRALRRNEILAILLDRPMPREAPTAVPVCFFGSRTYLPAGAARIALRTGAAVLPVALARVSGRDDRARVLIGSNLCCQRTGNEEEDVQTLTQAIVTAQEQFLRRFPDQWYMFRRMWPPPPEPRSQSQPRL